MTQIADTVGELTHEWFTDALREGGTIPAQAVVASAESRLIGTGQLGLVALAELRYDGAGEDAPTSVVVKLPSEDAGSRGLGAAMGVYESEVRFYQEIAPRLPDAAIPRMHWGQVDPQTGRFTLVIDDLSPTAEVGDMVGGGTLAQAELAIGELVKIQAPLWNEPRLHDQAWLGLARTEMLFSAVAPALEPFVERFGERLDPAHVDLARRLIPKAPRCVKKVWKPPFVVGHGDYRLDNMLFGCVPGAPPISVIDWQGARLAPPLLDAAIYLGSCLGLDERRIHEEELLRGYHEKLCAAGIDGFSFADCLESYRGSSLYPFLLTVAVSVTLARTERGDQMWAQLFSASADVVRDTGAAALLD